jgi:hypothetical protein
LRGGGRHGVGDVVDLEVVVAPDPRRHRAAAAVAERHHDRAPDVRLERDFFSAIDLPSSSSGT